MTSMKNFKIFYFVAATIICFAAMAVSCKSEPPQPENISDFTITVNGQEVKDGQTFNYNTEGEDGLINPQIRITKNTDSPIEATLIVANDANAANTVVQVCGWQGTSGNCLIVNAGTNRILTQIVSDNIPQDPKIEILAYDSSFNAKVTITLAYNDKTQTIYWICKN